jgi:hypothetical protein
MNRNSNFGDRTDESLSPSYGFRIGFSLIECQGCGINRIRGVVCADCGAAPAHHEFDHKRQKRQQVARQALIRLEQGVNAVNRPLSSPGEIATELLARLDGLPGRFLSALQGAIEDPTEGASALDAAIDEIADCVALVSSTPRLRPWHRLLDKASALVSELNQTGSSYLKAVLANTPLEAQRSARDGQSHLDSVAKLVPEVIEAGAIWTSDSIDPHGLMLDLLNLGFEDEGVRDVIELDASGRQIAQRVFGSDIELQLGAGLMIAITFSMSRQLFDERAFETVLRESRTFLLSHPTKLLETLNSPHLRADLTDAAGGLTMAALVFQAVNAARLPNRANLAALIDLGKTSMESMGKRVIAAIQSVGVKASYETLRDKGVADVLNSARNGRAKSVLAGFDLSIRHAGAHMDFKIENNKVILAPEKNPREFSLDEFIDHFTQNLEILCANHVALLVVAGEQGVDLSDLSFLDLLEFNIETKISLFLSLWGWDVDSVETHADRIEIFAAVEVDTPFIAPIKTALSLLTTGVEFARFILTSEGSSEHILEGPISLLARIVGAPDGGDSLVEVASKWRLDGLPLISTKALRRWSASQCLAVADEEISTSIRRLRYLRELANAADDSELSVAIKRLISATRVNAQGFDVNAMLRAKDAFSGWLSMRIDPASEMIIDNLATAKAWGRSSSR